MRLRESGDKMNIEKVNSSVDRSQGSEEATRGLRESAKDFLSTEKV